MGDALDPASAYWTTWAFDALGNRTEQTKHNLTAGADTTTTYNYNGNGSGQPYTLTSTTTTGGGTASTSYTYDASGNMTGRDAASGNQTLTWDSAGRISGITGSSAGNTGIVYDGDGNLLLEKDPGSVTLYLPNEQLTLDTGNQSTSGVRYYTLADTVGAVRTGAGSAYTFEVTDLQGTPTLYLDSTVQTPTWRQYTPYGAARGTATGPWPDNRGFLDKPAMTGTGLTMVGVRMYDPETGRFVSTDPVPNSDDPQSLNSYGYADGNAVSNSDPTGATTCVKIEDVDGPCIQQANTPAGQKKIDDYGRTVAARNQSWANWRKTHHPRVTGADFVPLTVPAHYCFLIVTPGCTYGPVSHTYCSASGSFAVGSPTCVAPPPVVVAVGGPYFTGQPSVGSGNGPAPVRLKNAFYTADGAINATAYMDSALDGVSRPYDWALRNAATNEKAATWLQYYDENAPALQKINGVMSDARMVRIGGALAVLSGGIQGAEDLADGKSVDAAIADGTLTGLGGWGGAWAGAEGGALIGGAIGGPAGALVGGFLGAAFGGLGGGAFGHLIGGLF